MAGQFGLPNIVRADDIYNTFGPGLTYSASSRPIFDSTIPELVDYTYGVLAQGFRTPAYATRIDRVTVPFLMDNPADNISPVTISIFTGESPILVGPPLGLVGEFLGVRVADLTQRTVLSGGAPSAPTTFSYTSTTPVLLDPDSFYWLVAQVTREPGMDAINSWYQSGFTHPYVLNSFVGGFPFGDPYDFDSDKYFAGFEWDPDGLGLAMRIEATAVPEPTTLSLIAVSTLALLTYRWRLRFARRTASR
jgi:hypothetical protein